MGLFRKKNVAIDQALPPDEWIRASEAKYEELVSQYYGSPETMAQGGYARAELDDWGTALFFFRKSIDIVHTQCFGPQPIRQPGPQDDPILLAFVSTLENVKRTHANAPIDETIREVTHRIRAMSSLCERTGTPASRYLSALDAIAGLAPEVNAEDILWN